MPRPGFHYFPLLPMLQRLAAEVPGLEHRDQPRAAAAAQPGGDRGGRRLPRRDHRRALHAGRGARLPPGGVRDLRGADGGAGEPARRGRGDHPAALDRGQGDASRAGTGPSRTSRSGRARSSRPRPPILVGSQVPAGIARAARIADGWLVVPVPRVDEFAAQATAFTAARAKEGLSGDAADLPAARGGLRARRGHRDPARRALPAGEVRGLSSPGGSRASRSIPPPSPRSSSAAWPPTASPSARPPR